MNLIVQRIDTAHATPRATSRAALNLFPGGSVGSSTDTVAGQKDELDGPLNRTHAIQHATLGRVDSRSRQQPARQIGWRGIGKLYQPSR